MKFIGLNGVQYQLASDCLGKGGEGAVYRVQNHLENKLVAKMYNKPPSSELVEKLHQMVRIYDQAKDKLRYLIWPSDVLFMGDQVCGYVMKELDSSQTLDDVYAFPPRLKIDNRQKVRIAKNICAVLDDVHNTILILGDFNSNNVCVVKDGYCYFIDTDSCHIRIDKTTYRCVVCKPGYAAPELLNRCRAHTRSNPDDKDNVYATTPLPTFTKETDNFALAIHIFQLLMNGYSPYSGLRHSQGGSLASPGVGDEPVRLDAYCFKDGYEPPPKAAMPRLTDFPQDIVRLFTRAFIEGKKDPKQRPTAKEWYAALDQYERNLIPCRSDPLHQYDKKNEECPYCRADRRALGVHEQVVIATPYYRSSFTDIFEAALKGTVQDIFFFMDRGVGVNTRDYKGRSPLHYAAESSMGVGVLNYLILKGADINARDEKGFTPLHLAARKDSIEVLETLIVNGSDVNAQSNIGGTPLHSAAVYGSNVEILQYLVSKGANINARENRGFTPLHLAVAKNDNVKILEYFAYHPNILLNLANYKGAKPIHYADTEIKVQILRHAILTKGGKYPYYH